MYRNNQRIPMSMQCDSIVQSLKKADFLKPAAGSVRFVALRQPVLLTVRRGVFLCQELK